MYPIVIKSKNIKTDMIESNGTFVFFFSISLNFIYPSIPFQNFPPVC